MADDLKRRIREHGRRDRRDAFFSERLLDLAERIEREFLGEERDRLLSLASDAFDRHREVRDSTLRTRERLDRLREDQMLLSDLFARVGRRQSGALLH